MTVNPSIRDEYPRVPEWQSGYRWICSMCKGFGLVADMDDCMKIADCPNCAFAMQHGTAFEVVRRSTAPAIGSCERVASPAVHSQMNYELWQFIPAEEKARRLFVSWDVGEVYQMKWEVEEEARMTKCGLTPQFLCLGLAYRRLMS